VTLQIALAAKMKFEIPINSFVEYNVGDITRYGFVRSWFSDESKDSDKLCTEIQMCIPNPKNDKELFVSDKEEIICHNKVKKVHVPQQYDPNQFPYVVTQLCNKGKTKTAFFLPRIAETPVVPKCRLVTLPIVYHGDGLGTFRTVKNGIEDHSIRLASLPRSLQQQHKNNQLFSSFNSSVPSKKQL
jgi:hypothetical protein